MRSCIPDPQVQPHYHEHTKVIAEERLLHADIYINFSLWDFPVTEIEARWYMNQDEKHLEDEVVGEVGRHDTAWE